jgi:phosphoenolpyruvate synthase/pyruvate phosphate dikinase
MVAAFLGRLRTWILDAPLPAGFEQRFRARLEQTFGADGSFGVFVRSDTNVEDLPGFTGAGLNLTVPNVVGNDQIIEALHQVWASPFTERSYGWRQNNMVQPLYVFPAVVVQRAVPSEKSGVMVTADLEGGGMHWLSVAVNEGVGGAVEGQATESLRINLNTGEVQFLAQATAPLQAALAPGGGIDHVPTSGSDSVLKPAEITQLLELARAVPKRFPSLRNEDGSPIPADIEFAFKAGRLILLQIRPFVENRRAQSNEYLVQLDSGLEEKGLRQVDLSAAPGAE